MTDDQLETATEDLPKEIRIEASGVVAFAIISLATYGAQDLGRKAFAKANKIRTNRKTKKAESKQDEKSDETPAEEK